MTDRHDRAACQFARVAHRAADAQRTLPERRYINQANDAVVRLPTNDREFAKILVQRDEHSLLLVGATKDRFIPGIGVPVGGPHDIMSACFEFGLRESRYTRIEQ